MEFYIVYGTRHILFRLTAKYQTRNGGFRKLTNVDRNNQPYQTDHYNGLFDMKEVKLLFLAFNLISIYV